MTCANKEQENCEVEKRGCKGCAYNEKTADEMFEELGYEISDNVIDDELLIAYENVDGYIIFYKDKYVGLLSNEEGSILIVNIQELQAINKKCRELGWKGE